VFSTPNDLAFKVAAAVGRYVAKERVGGLATQLKSSLGVAELTTRTLTEGRTLSDASEDTRNKVKRLLGELFSTMNEFPEPVKHDPVADPETILAVAEGLMAQGKWLDAGRKLEEYAAEKPDDWEACNLRGVAFANSRAGQTTDLAALRACNDAIAFIPASIEVNMRARLFAYRGAILKRLRRLEEAEADLMIAKRHATREYEVEDVIYNLAGVFALQGERQKMLAEIAKLSTKPDVLAAIRGHLDDYFHAFSQDPEFLNMIGAWEK
jgi:Flp pilus assembly protein TadD